jgi:hypothetical protein
MSNIPGKHDINELMNTATFATEHILQEVLISKSKTFTIGNSIRCTIHSNHGIDAALHSLQIWYHSGT